MTRFLPTHQVFLDALQSGTYRNKYVNWSYRSTQKDGQLRDFGVCNLQCDQIGRFLKVRGKVFLKSSRNICGLWPILKISFLRKKMLWPLVCNFWEPWGCFLFQHLVSLDVNNEESIFQSQCTASHTRKSV